jgi:hypothetical protein
MRNPKFYLLLGLLALTSTLAACSSSCDCPKCPNTTTVITPSDHHSSTIVTPED